MDKNITNFFKEGKAILYIKTNNTKNIEDLLIEKLKFFENKKLYIYENNRTINYYTNNIEIQMHSLTSTLYHLYPEGIRKIPIFLIIKGNSQEILNEETLKFFKEVVELKNDNIKYCFSIIIINKESLPEQLKNLVNFTEIKISNEENECNIKKAILNLASFEEIKLTPESVNKLLDTLKNNIRKEIQTNKKNELNQLNIIEETSKFDDMIFVKGGKYRPYFDKKEKVIFNIEVSKTLITQSKWEDIMRYNPSYFKGEKRPVERVTWWDALEFCNKLSEKYKLEPVYDLSNRENEILLINELGGEKKFPDKADFRKTEGFRLPTEAEWEWFAKGGEKALNSQIFYYKYSGSNNIDEIAWYENNSKNQTHDTCLKKPNQLGLYDCCGNVWEWCYDTQKNFQIYEEKQYTYDSNKKLRRIRGGAWSYPEFGCMVSNYNELVIKATNHSAIDFSYDIGFRVVRTV